MYMYEYLVRFNHRSEPKWLRRMNIVPAPVLLRLIRSRLARGASAALLGMDVGTRWIGIGVTDRECRLTIPLTTVERVPGTLLGLTSESSSQYAHKFDCN